ncbi:MAG: hypothetical protein M0Z56_08585 [Desulfobacteraceae bacterium]|nr:hypothetical protein [Desulfobacteraceae bacterium]
MREVDEALARAGAGFFTSDATEIFSAFFSDETINSNGIKEVIRENIQRFFAPFDR